MHSFIIISEKRSALDIASSLSPYSLVDHIDNFFIDSTEKIGIDTVRDIKKFLQNKPYNNSHKIIFIHSADLLTPQAQNSLLKTLEEPPGDSLIFLATSNIDKLLPTVISRCQIVKDTKHSTTNLLKKENSFTQVVTNIKDLNEGERISLASQYAYPKTKAVGLCKDAITFLKHSLHSHPSIQTASNLKLASTTLQRLESNVDPKLSLEHFFLNLLIK